MAKLIDIENIKPIDFPSVEMDGLDVVRYLNTLPTADAVEVVHGQWVNKPIDGVMTWIREDVCNVCGFISDERFNYCPNCGAKMDGDGNG